VQQDEQADLTRTDEKPETTYSEAEADRAIQMVRSKLSSRLNVEADVRRLVLEATDPYALSKMYGGLSLVLLTLTFKDGVHIISRGDGDAQA
jgi:FATC domain